MARPRNRRLAPSARFRRSFVTPEGVDLKIELAPGGARFGAFVLDSLMMLAILVVCGLLVAAADSRLTDIFWFVGSFALRNGWFILFEMGGRGATPGKRIVGLRVVARDGARLTGGAVIVRNAMREIEFFLPFQFFLASLAFAFLGRDMLLPLLALGWSLIFGLFPLFNRDRLRVGDLLAGTWVVRRAKVTLGHDFIAAMADSRQPRRTFGEDALSLYGEYELQTLEEVLRSDNEVAMVTVAAAIRRKAGIPDDHDDYGFLTDYYAALCVRLERQMMVGLRRADKNAAATREAV